MNALLLLCYNHRMGNFTIKELSTPKLKQELEKIGFDKSYADEATKKYRYKNFKIYDLELPQAHILKQTAISVGADCATHRETITAQIAKTDVILGGSLSQLKKIAQKLFNQPFSMPNLAQQLENLLEDTAKTLKVMGILNLTKDSFSDGGKYFNFEDAKARIYEMIEEGADIIDIGAESTRPEFEAVSDEKQLQRLLPVLDLKVNVPISVDTRSAKVAREAIKHGAAVINDVSGLQDEDMAKVCAEGGVKLVITHNSTGGVDKVYQELAQLAKKARLAGVLPKNIILDVGIGFGKSREESLELLRSIKDFQSLGYPLLVGISRKSLLEIPEETNAIKDALTLALNAQIADKVNYIRVHNIKLHKLLQVHGLVLAL